MYTMCSAYYKEHAIFREDTFYLIPAGKTPDVWQKDVWLEGHERRPLIFHWCPELAKRSGDKIGIIWLVEDAESMLCERCHKRPGTDITTIWTLLKEA
jgi:hypothetical protein